MTRQATVPRNSGPAQSLGAWLRAERIAHRWSIAEMARQLHKAVKAADDNTVTSASIIATYVRRWEQDKIAPTERYRLHYCAALNIRPAQFGPGSAPVPDQSHAPSEGGADETPGNVLIVIPDGCRQVVIYMTGTDEADDSQSEGDHMLRVPRDKPGTHRVPPDSPRNLQIEPDSILPLTDSREYKIYLEAPARAEDGSAPASLRG